jgi:hypothetical protein
MDALMGCTEDSPEEWELILWAEIADRYEQVEANQPRLASAFSDPR